MRFAPQQELHAVNAVNSKLVTPCDPLQCGRGFLMTHTERSPSRSRARPRTKTCSASCGIRATAASQSDMAPCGMHDGVNRNASAGKASHLPALPAVPLETGQCSSEQASATLQRQQCGLNSAPAHRHCLPATSRGASARMRPLARLRRLHPSPTWRPAHTWQLHTAG